MFYWCMYRYIYRFYLFDVIQAWCSTSVDLLSRINQEIYCPIEKKKFCNCIWTIIFHHFVLKFILTWCNYWKFNTESVCVVFSSIQVVFLFFNFSGFFFFFWLFFRSSEINDLIRFCIHRYYKSIFLRVYVFFFFNWIELEMTKHIKGK